MRNLSSLIEELQKELSKSVLFCSLNNFPFLPILNANVNTIWINSYIFNNKSNVNFNNLEYFSEEEAEPCRITNKLYLSKKERKRIKKERRETIRLLKSQNESSASTIQISGKEIIKKYSLLLVMKPSFDKITNFTKWIQRIIKEKILFGTLLIAENYIFMLLEGRMSNILKFQNKILKNVNDSDIKVNYTKEVPKLSMKKFKMKNFENLANANEYLLRDYSINLYSYNL
jgi:hypothetical protein